MIVFPAIDLIAGKVVRLEKGDRRHAKVYSDDPAAVARSFLDQGARWVHVVDLPPLSKKGPESSRRTGRPSKSSVPSKGFRST